MSGRGLFVALVGPSGAGKDSLIRDLAARFRGDPGFAVVKRYVTRAADAHEDHHTLDIESFEALAQAGRFALTWRAHGLSYGVPVEVDAELNGGRTLVCNLSRAAVSAARRRWPDVWVALVTASPATLAARLAGRGREAEADRGSRLARAPLTETAPDVVIDNDGDFAEAADRLYRLLAARRSALP
jgi:ribose 1,5-bisphosphokinase